VLWTLLFWAVASSCLHSTDIQMLVETQDAGLGSPSHPY